VAVTVDGNYYIAEIDVIKGGECKIIEKKQILLE
jgi:hypothetical protein